MLNDPTMLSRRFWIPSTVPILVLFLAAWGQVKEQAAVIALVAGGFVVAWGLILVLALVVQLVRRVAVGSLVVATVLSAFALAAVAALAVDTPLWVRWRAAPVIQAIERTRAESGQYPAVDSLEGDFPRPVRAALEAGGHCLYRPRGASYHLACLGVPFSKCGYDGATARWTGWE